MTAGDRFAVREIDGVRCTDRAGLAVLVGRPRGSVDQLAHNDPEFPTPAGRAERRLWYSLDDARRYARILAARREQLKPPPVSESGDPDELLDAEQAAALIHVTYGTFRFYVRKSIPEWEQGKNGILPIPDEETPAPRGVRRYWRRHTLAEHQAIRPGRGAGAGRPALPPA